MPKYKDKNTVNQQKFAKEYKEVTDIDFTDRVNIKKSVAQHRTAQRKRAVHKKILATSVEEFIKKGGKIKVLPPAESNFKQIIKSKTRILLENAKHFYATRENLLAEEEE